MDNELYHYGVPGMRWGFRKIRRVATSNKKPRNKEEAEKYNQAKKIYSKTQNTAKNLKTSTKGWTRKQKERIAFNILNGDSLERAEGKEHARMGTTALGIAAVATAAAMIGAKHIKSGRVLDMAAKGANFLKRIP